MNFDFTKMMEMATRIQQLVAEQGKELESRVYEGEAGGGLVKVRVNGRAELLAVEIDPILGLPKDKEMLEDLMVSAANSALAQAKAGTGHDIEDLLKKLASSPEGGS